MSNRSYIAKLGAFVASMDAAALPSDVVEHIKSCLLYNVSLALATIRQRNTVHQAIEAIYSAPGRCSIFGKEPSRNAADAACLNASLITARGQNDTHPGINGHIGCVVIPAVLALAEERNARAADVLAALTAGYEILPRIAGSAVGDIVARGFRGTSVFAVFGAAAACARVLRLTEDETSNAISIATNYCAGLVQCYAEGTMEWQIQVAEAARAGVISALMAEQGVVAATGALEGEKGFYHAYARSIPSLIMEGWTIDQVTFKPYPGCAINQLPTATLIQALDVEGISQHSIDRIELALHPSHAQYPGIDRAGPFTTEAAAIMSAPFMLSIAAEKRTLSSHDFSKRYADDPIHEWSQRVTVTPDSELKPFECRVVINTRDGRVFSIGSRGSKQLVFDWQRTVRLCRDLSQEWTLPNADAILDRICETIQRMDRPEAEGFAKVLASAVSQQ